MSEVIKATLTADSSELQAEFAKARKAAEEYHRRVEESQSKALRGEMDQLRLLRLQAEGRTAEATALREKIGLQAQAEAMAKRIGLTEQESLNLLQQRAQLERQIASRAQAGKPNIQNLPLTAGELNGVWVQSERARASLKATQLQAKGTGTGMLQLAQAADDVQYGMRGIVNNIPGLVMGFGGTSGLAGTIGLAVVAAYSLYKVMGMITGDTELQKWEESRKKALEEYGRALERNLERLKDTRRAERIGSEMAEMKEREAKAIREGIGLDKERFAALERQTQQLANQRRLIDELAKARQAVAEERATTPEQKRAVTNRATSDNFQMRASRVASDITATQKELAEASKQIERSGKNAAEAWTKYQSTIGSANAEIEKARDIVAQYETELVRVDAALADKTGKGTDALRRNEEQNRKIAKKKLEETKAALELKEAEKKAAEELLKTAMATREQTRKELLDKVDGLTLRKESLEAERENLELLRRAEAERAKAEEKKAAEERAIEKDTALKDLNTETEALKLEVAGRKKAAELLREQNVTRKEAAQLAKQLGIPEAEALKKLEEQANYRKQIADRSRSMSAQEFMGELKVLQLQASGRKDLARALSTEIELRKEAKKVAEEQGITEQKALAVVRHKERLKNQIKRGPSSRIRRAPRFHTQRIPSADPSKINAAGGRRIDAAGGRVPNAAGGRRIGLVPQGLAPHEIRRRGEKRQPTQGDQAALQAARYFERSLSLQESTLAVWKKLGVL